MTVDISDKQIICRSLPLASKHLWTTVSLSLLPCYCPMIRILYDRHINHLYMLTSQAPLAIIPPSAGPIEEAPIPASSLSYFPHHLAYRAETLMPSPSPYIANPEGLGGQNVDVVTIIRMPMPEGMYVRRAESGARGGTAVGEDEDEDEDMEAVVREWGGMELGIMKVGVEGNENGSMVRG